MKQNGKFMSWQKKIRIDENMPQKHYFYLTLTLSLQTQKALQAGRIVFIPFSFPLQHAFYDKNWLSFFQS